MTISELIEKLRALQTCGSNFVDNPEVVLYEPAFSRWFEITAVNQEVDPANHLRITIVSGPECKP